MLYRIKKLWLSLSIGRGPKLPPYLCVPLRNALKPLVLGGAADTGLCTVIERALDQACASRDWPSVGRPWLRHQFKLWPHYSGAVTYPVPHPTMEPGHAYWANVRYSGEYGKMRRSLARHLYDAAQRDLGIK